MGGIGDEGAGGATAFAAPETADVISTSKAEAVASPYTNVALPGRSIDLRWWLAALGLGAGLWAMILNI